MSLKLESRLLGEMSITAGVQMTDFTGSLVGKESTCNAGVPGVTGLIPRSGRHPGGGHGNPLQYPCLRIPWTEERGRLQSMGVTKIQT